MHGSVWKTLFEEGGFRELQSGTVSFPSPVQCILNSSLFKVFLSPLLVKMDPSQLTSLKDIFKSENSKYINILKDQTYTTLKGSKQNTETIFEPVRHSHPLKNLTQVASH